MDFTLNRTWPTFYDYIPVFKAWIQYTNLSKDIERKLFFKVEIFSKFKKGHNSQNNWWILPEIELDLHFMIIYPCLKFQSSIPIFSKDIARKPFVLRTGRTGWTGRTGRDGWAGRTHGQWWYYMPAPIENGKCIKMVKTVTRMFRFVCTYANMISFVTAWLFSAFEGELFLSDINF